MLCRAPIPGLSSSLHTLMLRNFITVMKNSLCSLTSIRSFPARRKANPGHSSMCSLVISGGPLSCSPSSSCSPCSCSSCSHPWQPEHCILPIYRPGMSAGISNILFWTLKAILAVGRLDVLKYSWGLLKSAFNNSAPLTSGF